MTEQALPHKLAVILYADVEGYSRLTGQDEAGTHRIVSAYLDFFSDTIRAHQGEVKHYAGDAVLADFSTVSDALNCAVAVQRELQQRNDALPKDKRVQFRIGLNLGEVIVDRGEVYGHGVNVAARLETLAEPGGICVSRTVVDAIGTKLPLSYDFLGEQRVKNIDKPLRAYRVNLTGDPATVNNQRGRTMRILLVDDEELVREALADMLRGREISEQDRTTEVHTVGTCEEAIATCSKMTIDLALLDLGLPGMSGVQALERFRAACEDIPVVVLSGHDDADTVKASIAAGAMGFIPKRAKREIMFMALKLVVVAKGTYIPPSVMAPSTAMQATTTGTGATPPRLRSLSELDVTERQLEVGKLMLQNLPNKVIARKLAIAEPTVKVHVSAFLRALDVTNRADAILAVYRQGFSLESGAGASAQRPG
jgi:DNA-binding NarL/FixJ family response regulator/class 3 adenylate cyclase